MSRLTRKLFRIQFNYLLFFHFIIMAHLIGIIDENKIKNLST